MISLAERGALPAGQIPTPHRAHVVGLTGAPGSGKSTLVDGLASRLRAAGERVAILAVDPTSPVSGGAVLGDRLRMQDHATDPGVFVRSMASRGALGGLAPGIGGAVRVLDATGWPWVVIETVGVGQVEVDVSGVADTTVVVVTPGWGDEVQTEKAGILEVADVLVVNKGDRPGADQAKADLDRMLDLAPRAEGMWRPPVMMTVASVGHGVERLWAAVLDHRSFLARGDGRGCSA